MKQAGSGHRTALPPGGRHEAWPFCSFRFPVSEQGGAPCTAAGVSGITPAWAGLRVSGKGWRGDRICRAQGQWAPARLLALCSWAVPAPL